MLYLCFIGSGGTGLIYEILWEKYLVLWLGATSSTHGLLLAIFLGGLALGAWRLGPRLDRAENPIRSYALLEGAVALMAAGTSVTLPMGFDALTVWYRDSGAEPAVYRALQVGWALANLLPPAFLMGGTLPALSRGLTAALPQAGSVIGRLYALNALGGSAAIVWSAYTLIPTAGYDIALRITAIANAIVAVLSYGIGRRYPLPPRAETASAAAPTPSRRWLLGAVLLSGAVSLMYEIAWIRLMALVMGASTHAFSHMLSAFIAGIGLGAWAAKRRLERGLSPWAGYAATQLGAAMATAIGLHYYAEIPFLFAYASRALSHEMGTYWIYASIQFFTAFSAMVLPALFIGASLPMAAAAEVEGLDTMSGRLGLTYGWNTLGNVIGALLAGSWLLPTLGVEGLIRAGVIVNLLLGAGLWLGWRSRLPRGWFPTGVAAAGLAIAALWSAAGWFDEVTGQSPFRNRRVASSREAFRERRRQMEVFYHRDGKSQSVTVVKQPGTLVLLNNNKPDASSKLDMNTQRNLAFVPLSQHPFPRRVLIVGMGSGCTVGMATLFAEPEVIDVVEIEPAAVEASRYFAEWNQRYWEDPRVRLHINDARHFLQTTRENYDVIINEPTNPWVAGVGNLFTVEYYALARQRLNPGGLLLSWVQNYEISDSEVVWILNSLRDSFPFVDVYNIGGKEYDSALLASLDPLVYRADRVEHAYAQPEILAAMQAVQQPDPESFAAIRLLPSDMMEVIPRDGERNRDRHPVLEYTAPRSFFYGHRSRIFHVLAEGGTLQADEEPPEE